MSQQDDIRQRYEHLVLERLSKRDQEHRAYRNEILHNPLIMQDDALIRINQYNREIEAHDILEKACAMAQATLEIYGPLTAPKDIAAWQPALDMAYMANPSGRLLRYPLPKNGTTPNEVEYARIGEDLFFSARKMEQGSMTESQFVQSALRAISNNVFSIDKAISQDFIASFDRETQQSLPNEEAERLRAQMTAEAARETTQKGLAASANVVRGSEGARPGVHQ